VGPLNLALNQEKVNTNKKNMANNKKSENEFLLVKHGTSKRKLIKKGLEGTDREKPISEKRYEKKKANFEKRGGYTFQQGPSTITVNKRDSKALEKFKKK